VRIDQARAARPRGLQFRRHGVVLTFVLVPFQDRLDRLAGDLQVPRRTADRLTAIPAANDLIAELGIHARLLPAYAHALAPAHHSGQGDRGQKVFAQFRHHPPLLHQAFETLPQQLAVAQRQLPTPPMVQPVLHPRQLLQ